MTCDHVMCPHHPIHQKQYRHAVQMRGWGGVAGGVELLRLMFITAVSAVHSTAPDPARDAGVKE
jgi:hypothetical protein